MVPAGGLHSNLRAQLLQNGEFHDLRHDELLLEIPMDGACRLRCLVAFSDGPRFHLVCAAGEEIDEVHHVEGGGDDLVHRAHSGRLVEPCLSGVIGLHILELLLESPTVGDHGAAGRILGDPLVDLLQELVFLTAVVLLIHVDRKHTRLSGQEHVIVQELDIDRCPILHVHLHILPRFQAFEDLLHR